jgi:glyoxylase-like metal-dependent hydrolase (beta-lactamase superfamily II)
LNLGGGVTARLLWFGAAHTKGDELIFVDPDKTLISGDVVQKKVSPHVFAQGGTASSWIAAVEQAEKLGALHVLPDHSPIGDGSVVAEQKAFLTELRARALELKKDGKTVEQAGQQLTGEVHQKYPDWNIDDLTGFVKVAYSE